MNKKFLLSSLLVVLFLSACDDKGEGALADEQLTAGATVTAVAD